MYNTIPVNLLNGLALRVIHESKPTDSIHKHAFTSIILPTISKFISSISLFIEFIFFLKYVRKSPDECKYVYIIMQLVLGFVMFFTGSGWIALLSKLFWALIVLLLHGNAVKVIWGVSLLTSIGLLLLRLFI